MKRILIPCLSCLLVLILSACALPHIEKQPTSSTTTTTKTTHKKPTTDTLNISTDESTVDEGSTTTSSTSLITKLTDSVSSSTSGSTANQTITTKSTSKNITTTTAVTTNAAAANFAAEVLRLVNVERNAEGLPALSAGDAASHRAAAVRAAEIQQSFSHTRPNGSEWYSALYEAGVTYYGAGENIAWGQRTPAAVVNAWMNSPGHRSNIMSISYTHLAVCFDNYYWVQLFYRA